MTSPIEEVAAILDGASIAYAIIGGHAVNAWLEPRFTADVDVTAQADASELARLKQAFLDAGYRTDAEHGAAQPSGPDFVRFVSSEGTTIAEVQLAKTDLQRDVVARAVSDAGRARVATPEDLIVLKLIANRSKDQADLRGLSALPGLDWAYVEARCQEWDLALELARLRA